MSEHSPFQRVARDVLDLCELQWELLSVDTQQAKRAGAKAIVFGSIAGTLSAAGSVVALVGGGFLLSEFTNWSAGISMLVVAGVATLISCVLLWFTWSLTKRGIDAMAESRSEFSENLRWLKATLINPQTSARNQIRSDSFSNSGEVPEVPELASLASSSLRTEEYRNEYPKSRR